MQRIRALVHTSKVHESRCVFILFNSNVYNIIIIAVMILIMR